MRIRMYSCILSLLFILFLNGYVLAEEPLPGITKVLAVVPVKSGAIDKNVYRQIDRLVPELKKYSKSNIVKLECRYSGRKDREKDVENAYKLAARIEKYLRDQHKLDLDLWVAIDIMPPSAKASPVLTIAVFSDDIKRLDSVRVDAEK